jgi:hypothetical protein
MTHLNLITSATATLLVLALATSATAQDGHDDHAPETTAHAKLETTTTCRPSISRPAG